MIDNKLIQAAFRVGKYIATFLAFYFISTPLHEWGHLLMCSYLGGECYIERRTTLAGTYNLTVFVKDPSSMFLFSLAGGITVAVVFSLIYLFDWYSNDVIGAMAILPSITRQLVYGITEGVCYNMKFYQFVNIGSIATTLGFMVGLSISLWVTVNYIANDLYKGEKKVTLT